MQTKKLHINQLSKAVQSSEYIGFCVDCGTKHTGIEPDARGYECENCNKTSVFGAEEILIMGEYNF